MLPSVVDQWQAPIMKEGSTMLIGVGIAVAGNIIVSVALNLQKLVHLKLSTQAQTPTPEPQSETAPLLERPREFQFYKQPLWWLGLTMMFTGEIGNFLAYAFAPGSLVAPLGIVALVSNCFVAPLLVGETFRIADIGGIFFCITGAAIVVLSSQAEERSLTPHELLEAASEGRFIVYTVVCVAATFVFYSLSFNKRIAKYVCTEAYMCSLAGGFTVLTTKAFTLFLKQMHLAAFKDPVVLCVVAILLFTAIIQILFLQWAMQKYESKIIVPTQFCSFSFCAVTGSAILFHEFDDAPWSVLVRFGIGCVACAVGVIWLTWTTNEEEAEREAASAPQLRKRRSFVNAQMAHTLPAPSEAPSEAIAITPSAADALLDGGAAAKPTRSGTTPPASTHWTTRIPQGGLGSSGSQFLWLSKAAAIPEDSESV